MCSSREAINGIKNEGKFLKYKLNASKHQLNLVEVERKKLNYFPTKKIQSQLFWVELMKITFTSILVNEWF